MRISGRPPSQQTLYKASVADLRKSRSRSKSPPIHEDVVIRLIPRPECKPTHPLDLDQSEAEIILKKVREIAANSLPQNLQEPGLTELLKALDFVTRNADLQQNFNFELTQELKNTAYRLLIKSEKQKAYDSVVSIQSEIYSMQGKLDFTQIHTDQKHVRQIETKGSDHNSRCEFTFAESINQSSAQENMATVRNSNWQGKMDTLKQNRSQEILSEFNLRPFRAGSQQRLSTFNEDIETVVNIGNAETAINSPSSKELTERTESLKGRQAKLSLVLTTENQAQSAKPPLEISLTRTSNTMGSQTTPMNPSSVKSCNIRNFLYNTQSNQGGTDRSHSIQAIKPSTNEFMSIDQPMILLSNLKPQPFNKTEEAKQITAHLRNLINLEPKQDDTGLSTFEVIESLIKLKQIPSFARRCQKLRQMRHEGQSKDSVDPQHVTFSDSLVADEPRNLVNCDISDVLYQKRHRSLPKLRLSKDSSEESTSSCETINSRSKSAQLNRAVDSNKVIVMTFYVKNLLLKGLRTFAQYRQEQESKRFLKEATEQRQTSKSLKNAFKALKTYMKVHSGHARKKRMANQYFKLKTGKACLSCWNMITQVKIYEDSAFAYGVSNLNRMKKLRLYKHWRTTILERKMMRVQYKTLKYISLQRTLNKAFFALSAYARFSIRDRYQRMKCKLGNANRLKFKAFKSWQKHHIGYKKKVSMNQIANQLYAAALKRQAIIMIKEYVELRAHRHQMRLCAQTLRFLQLKRQIICLLRKNQQLNNKKRQRNYQISQYYEVKLKQKLIRFLHASNIEFIERSVLSEDYLQRRKKRVILYLLKAYVRYNQGCFDSISRCQAYYCWMWLKEKNQTGLSFADLKYERRLSRKYQQQQGRANQLLKGYYQQTVFKAWKQECCQVLSLKRKFKMKVLNKVVSAWNERAEMNGKLRKRVLRNRKTKNLQTMLTVFRAFRQFAKKSKQLKLVQRRATKLAIKGCKSRYFNLWLNLYDRLTKEVKLDKYGTYATKSLAFKKFFGRWRQKYLITQKKKELSKRLKLFQSKNFKFKFFIKWVKRASKYVELEQADISILLVQRTKRLQLTFRALQSHCSIQRKKKELYSVLKSKLETTQLGRVVKTWRQRVPELKQKRILIQTVRQDYINRLQLKVFDALRSRRDYTIEKSTTYAIMTNAIQTLTLKRFFKKWEGLFGRRLGLQFLSDSLQKIQKRSFFTRGRNLVSQHSEIQSHMLLYREFKLLQCSIQGLCKHARRRDVLKEKIDSCTQMRELMLLSTCVTSWRKLIAQSKRNIKMVQFFIIQYRKLLLQKCFRVFAKRRIDRLKIKQVRRGYLDQLLRSVFYQFRNVIYQRKLLSFVSLRFKRQQAQKIIGGWRGLVDLSRQVAYSKLALINVNKQARVLQAWHVVAQRKNHLRSQLSHKLINNERRMIKRAFIALREQSRLRRLAQMRQRSILAFVMQKQQLKAFVMLMIATQSSKEYRKNKNVALIFFRGRLMNKVMFELKVNMTRRKCHRQCIVYLQRRRLYPKCIRSLQSYVQLAKIKRNLQHFAVGNLKNNLQRKAFNSLQQNAAWRIQNRIISEQLDNRFKERMQRSVLNAWANVILAMQEKRAKRYVLIKTIADIDRDNLIFKAFVGLRQITKELRTTNTLRLKIIRNNKKQSIFTNWINVIRNQKELASLQTQAKSLHLRHQIKSWFNYWTKRANAYQRGRVKAQTRQQKLVAMTFKCLKLASQLKKASAYATMWHQHRTQKVVIKSLRNFILRQRRNEEQVIKMQTSLGQKLLQKALLSFKYFVLTQKGASLIIAKLDQKILTKAFDALKYQTISLRISKEFVQLKKTELKQKTMKLWVARLVQVRKQKILLKPIIQNVHLQKLAFGFSIWKREAFREKFFSKINEHMMLPKTVATAIDCLRKWHKLTEFKRNAPYIEAAIQQMCKDNTKRKFFNVWLDSAIERAPISLFCSKIERIDIIIGARRGFEDILSHCHTQIIQENAVSQLIEERNQRTLMHSWATWRRQFKVVRAGQAVSEIHNEIELSKHLQYWKQAFYAKMQQRQHKKIEKLALEQAFAYHCSQKVKGAFTKLVFYLLKSRQKRQADQLRITNLAFRALRSILMHTREMKQRGSLFRKQRQLIQYKRQKSVETVFATWFQTYKEESVVRQFRVYREQKLMSAFLGQLVADMNIIRKLDKIGKHAALYFGKRRQTQLLLRCLNALKSYSYKRRIKQQRFEILGEKADEFRDTRITEKTFRLWKNQVGQPKKNRSTLYTVFSGWKFYTKERVLLKKYLFECGESIGDMSMMTTLEMKDSVRRLVANHNTQEEPQSFDQSMDKSLLLNQRVQAFTNQSMENYSKKRQVDDYSFKLQEERSHSSLAERRFSRLQQHSSLTHQSMQEDDSFDSRATPMIMHRSNGSKIKTQRI